MTIIVYRDGVMSADAAIFQGNLIAEYVRKITRLPDGGLIGCSGRSAVCREVCDWIANGADPEKRPAAESEGNFIALHVRPDGKVFRIEHDMKPYESVTEFNAIGAPFEFALGALAAGASAEDAVRLTIKYSIDAAGEVQTERMQTGSHATITTLNGMVTSITVTSPSRDSLFTGALLGD